MRRSLMVATVLVAVARPGAAQELQVGKDLIEACRSFASGIGPAAIDAVKVGICQGEIEALAWLAPGSENDAICARVPSGVTPKQMAKVVVDYLDQNRDRLREPFEGLALEALAHTWPCPKRAGWLDQGLD